MWQELRIGSASTAAPVTQVPGALMDGLLLTHTVYLHAPREDWG